MLNEPKIKEKIAKCLGGGYVSDYETNKVYQLFLPALNALNEFAVYDNHEATAVLDKLNGD